MATLFPPGLRLLDADGDPISGGKVRVYTANTTTLASLYSDVNLSSAISNPVVTDAAGYPANGGNECAIYCASGSYDVAFLDASDNVLASWDDYAPAGEGTDIERTLTGNGRFKVTGSAGAVMIQVGDPSPDDVGGTLTIEGQAGTQGELLTLDFASVNVTGTATEGGKKLQGVVHTEATTFSSAATVDIPLTNSPTGVRAWEIHLWDLSSSAGSQLYGRLSYDGGGTFKSGASDYRFTKHKADNNSGSPGTNVSVSSGADHVELIYTLSTAANRPALVKVFVLTPNSGSDSTWLRADGTALDTNSTNFLQISTAVGEGVGAYGRATHLRIFSDSGNLTGKYRVVPLRGFGE